MNIKIKKRRALTTKNWAALKAKHGKNAFNFVSIEGEHIVYAEVGMNEHIDVILNHDERLPFALKDAKCFIKRDREVEIINKPPVKALLKPTTPSNKFFADLNHNYSLG